MQKRTSIIVQLQKKRKVWRRSSAVKARQQKFNYLDWGKEE